MSYLALREHFVILMGVLIICIDGSSGFCFSQESSEGTVISLEKAIRASDLQSLRLLTSPKNVNEAIPELQCTPLQLAVMERRLSVIDFLLKNGANPNIFEKKRFHPLYIAAFNRDSETVKLLVGHHARWPREDPRSSGFYAVSNYLRSLDFDDDFIQRAGFGLDAKVQELDEDLFEASGHMGDLSTPENVAKLISAGASPNAIFQSGLCPLHRAVLRNRLDLVKLLLAKGADVDPINFSGKAPSPLTVAVKKGYSSIAEFLLSAGADVNAVDPEGRTPLDVTDDQHMISMLKKAGGKFARKMEKKTQDASANEPSQPVKTKESEATPGPPTKDRDEKDEEKPTQPPPRPVQKLRPTDKGESEVQNGPEE